jgi:hypothetical protein
MEAFVNVAEVQPVWSMIILYPSPAVAVAAHQIFSCCVCGATAVNQTVAIVKFTTGRSAITVVIENQATKPILSQRNVRVSQKKEPAAETEQKIQAAGAICINQA